MNPFTYTEMYPFIIQIRFGFIYSNTSKGIQPQAMFNHRARTAETSHIIRTQPYIAGYIIIIQPLVMFLSKDCLR